MGPGAARPGTNGVAEGGAVIGASGLRADGPEAGTVGAGTGTGTAVGTSALVDVGVGVLVDAG